MQTYNYNCFENVPSIKTSGYNNNKNMSERKIYTSKKRAPSKATHRDYSDHSVSVPQVNPLKVALELGSRVQSYIANADDFRRYLAEDDEIVMRKNARGQTLLHIFCLENFVLDFVDLLISAGSEINAADIDGTTPLMCCCYNNQGYRFISTLVKHGADMTATNIGGQTAMDIAISQRNYYLMRELAKNGDNPLKAAQHLFYRDIRLFDRQYFDEFLSILSPEWRQFVLDRMLESSYQNEQLTEIEELVVRGADFRVLNIEDPYQVAKSIFLDDSIDEHDRMYLLDKIVRLMTPELKRFTLDRLLVISYERRAAEQVFQLLWKGADVSLIDDSTDNEAINTYVRLKKSEQQIKDQKVVTKYWKQLRHEYSDPLRKYRK